MTSDASAPLKSAEVGAVVDARYRLDALLGEGGMATVWAATTLATGRPVAVKIMRDDWKQREDIHRRFSREARVARALVHPNIAPILDAFETEWGSPALVFDLLRGETLRQRLDRATSLSLEEASSILAAVASAAAAAHAEGVVHRDLKPENIFLVGEGAANRRVVVMDFGVAKLTAADGSVAMSAQLTRDGGRVGTPVYMAPEQGFGEADVDARADVWALGVVLYECLAGTRPIEGANLAQVLRRLSTSGIVPLQYLVAGLPDPIASLAGAMLSRDRSDRPTMLEVRATLERFAGAAPRG